MADALITAPQLQQFLLEDVTPTGNTLGRGSYGSVVELKMSGLLCAGKRIFEELIDLENQGADIIARKYYEECLLLSKLRHPNIVLFMGICFLEASSSSLNLPVLVMERLQTSLDDLLETTPNIPILQKYSILLGVARGLVYLHSRKPVIIHRDLTAKNVLLTAHREAKIADMGNSRIVNFQPGQSARTMTRGVPGTPVYMPPEAFEVPPRYGTQLDMFSFGHLTLFTMTQQFPGDLLPTNYLDEVTGRLVPRNEVERRIRYMEPLRARFGGSHTVVQLVTQCLEYALGKRPTASEALQTLQLMEERLQNEVQEVEREERELLQEIKRMKGVEGRKPTLPTGDHYMMSRGIRYYMKYGCAGGNTVEKMIMLSVGSEFPADIQVQQRLRDPVLADRATHTHGRLPLVVAGLHQEAAADLMATASIYIQQRNADLVRLCLDVAGKQRSKQYYLTAIEDFLKNCKEPAAVLCYMGHSEEGTGNWCFKNGTISFQEIFDLYRRHCSGKLLIIQPDCSYSGRWVTDCAETLDRMGIPPCGHRARERRILIKVIASCQPDQKAAEPGQSMNGVILKDDGTMAFYENKKFSDSQSSCATDFTQLTCCRGPNESCYSERALKNWTWQEAVIGGLYSRLFTVRCEDKGRPVWHIVVLSNKSEAHKERFVAAANLGRYNLADWGYIIESGQGEDVPESVSMRINTWMSL